MKKKKFKWLKVLGIVFGIIIVLIIVVNLIINNISDNITNISETELQYIFSEHTVTQEKMIVYVKGTGEITSFNIKTVEIPTYSSLKEKYVNDGDMVTAKQKLLQVVTDGYYQNVNSPISGMYFETENMGALVYQVYDLNNIGVEMYVSESDVANLSVGQKANVKITALNKEIEGTISYISKLPTDGKFKVKIKFNYTDEIKFGYGTSIKIIVAEKENVLVIPYNALQMDDDGKYYVIKKENEMDFYDNYMYGTPISDESKTYVEIGSITNSQVEIISGLQKGDIIAEWNW